MYIVAEFMGWKKQFGLCRLVLTALFFFSMGNIPYSSLARRAVQSTALSSRPGHKTGGVTNPGPGPPRAHSSGDANHTSSPTLKCQVLLRRGCLIQLVG